jgi:menaquinone-dependent protoporphyrinogen IX oxidase
MKKLIVCPKELGNTYKVCSYVSNNSDIELKVVTETTKIDLTKYDAIILASGVYGNHVHKNILNWLNNNQLSNVKIYAFLTWIGRGKSDKAAFDEVKMVVSEKGAMLEDNYIECFGKMSIVRYSHPNDNDCKKVLSWANLL